MLSSFFPGVEWMQLSPFPVIVLDFSDTCGITGNTCCILNSCLQLNEILSVDKPKDTVRMGWGWGNALRCWIKWHILWNVAKHPISFKDEAEEAQGIIQPETVLVKVCNSMKWRLKKWKLKDEKNKLFLESDFWRSKQVQSFRSIIWKAWSCKSTTCEAINPHWHVARSVQILSEYRPEKPLLPTTNPHSFDWRLWELCWCPHWLRIEPLESILGKFILKRLYSKAFLMWRI